MNKTLFIILVLLCFKTEAQTSVLNVADSLYANGNYSKAIEMYKTSNKLHDVNDKIAKAYVALGNYDEAISHYEKSISYNPNNPLVKYQYAKLLAKTKNFDKAVSVFNQLIAVDSLNPNYHYELGLVYSDLGDSLSIVEYKKSFNLDQTHQKATYKVAKYMLQKRKFDSVDYYVDIGLKSYKNNVQLISLKAQNYYWQQEYEEAVYYFEKLISLGETSQFIHEKLSFSYSESYQPEKAIEHGLLALKYDPKNTTNLFILGQLYEDVKDYEKAESYYKLAIALDDLPLDYEYSKLGRVLNYQKKHEEAIKIYNKALKEKPGDFAIAFYIVYTKDKYYKDIDTRIKLYKTYKTNYPKSPFLPMIEKRITELEQENFLKED